MGVRYDIDGRVAVVTLDRPDVLNAFDDDMGRGAVEAVGRAASSDDVGCIVITGAGRAFSAGEDLSALAGAYEGGGSPDLGRILVERYNPLIRAIRAAPKPVVAAVNGVAAGAGASIALACDVRIASEHAKLVLAFVGVGLVPDSGALWFLTKMVGAARATELAMSGAAIGAADALSLGLFGRVVAAGSFAAEWRAYAAELGAGPTRALSLIKRLVASAAEASLEEQLELEVAAQTEAGRTHDHIEGVRAFLAKRPPRFSGR